MDVMETRGRVLSHFNSAATFEDLLLVFLISLFYHNDAAQDFMLLGLLPFLSFFVSRERRIGVPEQQSALMLRTGTKFRLLPEVMHKSRLDFQRRHRFNRSTFFRHIPVSE
jgi:hypothetical protein